MRILRGSLKGLSVPVPDLEGLRPSQGKVREALWSILDMEERGAFVDLFSGGGLLAVEACSLGFGPVTAVEKHPLLCRNLEAFGKKHDLPLTVLREDVPRQLERWMRDGMTFPLIFADPPYAYDKLEKLLDLATALLPPGGRFILESQRPFPFESRADSIRFYGQTVLAFFTVPRTGKSRERP
jgi:16S rRNA (guanine966-N2)-methyltransferase